MGGENDGVPARQDVDLGARAGEARPGHPLLHDGSGREVGQVPTGQPGERIPGIHAVHAVHLEHDVAVSGATVVELDDHGGEPRALEPDALDCLEYLGHRAHVLHAGRHRDAGLTEEPAPRALEPQRPQAGRCPVDRHSESARHLLLGVGHVPRLDQSGPPGDQLAEVFEQVGPVEQLRGDRARARCQAPRRRAAVGGGRRGRRSAARRRSSRAPPPRGAARRRGPGGHCGRRPRSSADTRYRCSRAGMRSA